MICFHRKKDGNERKITHFAYFYTFQLGIGILQNFYLSPPKLYGGRPAKKD
jgi:hypothetical protein